MAEYHDHSIGQPEATSPHYVKSGLDNNNPGLGRGGRAEDVERNGDPLLN